MLITVSCPYDPQDTSLLEPALFGVKKTNKEDGDKHAMVLLILVRKEPLFPTPHTLSWVDRNRGNISGHFSVKVRSGWATD